VETTPHGAWLLTGPPAVAQHDEIFATLPPPAVAERCASAETDDYALRWLPGILPRFAGDIPA